MNSILSIGILLFTGFILGKIAKKIKLPKISGYILAGILLKPDVTGIMNNNFVGQINPLLTMALSFITFSIGVALLYAITGSLISCISLKKQMRLNNLKH